MDPAPPPLGRLDQSDPLAVPSSSRQGSRPSPARATSMFAQFKSRATSQPPGEKLPASGTSPVSGRDSPLSGGNGGAYGVIGGSRTPSRFGSGLPGPGTATRANSFSVAEAGLSQTRSIQNTSTLPRILPPHQEESTSSFPTFSPTSSVSPSPNLPVEPLPFSHSPPRAEPNVSRSRSHSLAGGPRMTTTDRFPLLPRRWMVDNGNGAFPRGAGGDLQWSPPKGHSSFLQIQDMSALFGHSVPSAATRPAISPKLSNRWLSGTSSNSWTAASSDPSRRGFLGASVSSGDDSQGVSGSGLSTLIGGFDNTDNSNNNNNGNGTRSGSSSRRHSVSVVGGPGGRRDVFGEAGAGMSSLTSPPGRGLGQFGILDEDLWPEHLTNALSLEVDSRRRVNDVEQRDNNARYIPISQSLPRFESEQRDSGLRASVGSRNDHFNSDFTYSSNRPDQRHSERIVSGSESQASGRSRFTFEPGPHSYSGGGATGLPGPGLRDTGNANSYRMTGQEPMFVPHTNQGGQEQRHYDHYQGVYSNPPSQFGGGSQYGTGNQFGGGPPFSGSTYQQRPPYPPQQQQGYRGNQQSNYGSYFNGQGQGQMSQNQYQRGPQQTYYNSGYSPAGQGYQNLPPYPQYQPPPMTPGTPDPNSPSSFSQLSLADLGKGIPLVSLQPDTPLYIVAFKSGRRDVYYCPDPTLLIGNGDWVIVEADRGSDLGTVVYDQVSSTDIREWQEKQATIALMSGASVHQPPGMAAVNAATPPKNKPKVLIGELAGADLHTLLAGAGPGGSSDQQPPNIRGPLAKEFMPKRIFAKSAQGPEDQARMADKLKDEDEALAICREKAAQRGLPMLIVDAEYQWDRRKLTFYFKADKRVDFRDLTKENFRIFKSRIWMSMVPRDDPRN